MAPDHGEGFLKLVREAKSRVKEENFRDTKKRLDAGEKVILVRRETSPEDVGGMYVAQGILTATGGKTSHAAVVARGWGKCCIVGAEHLDIDLAKKSMNSSGHSVREGEWITLDGGEGVVYSGEIALVRPEPPKAFATLLKWAARDNDRTMLYAAELHIKLLR